MTTASEPGVMVTTDHKTIVMSYGQSGVTVMTASQSGVIAMTASQSGVTP